MSAPPSIAELLADWGWSGAAIDEAAGLLEPHLRDADPTTREGILSLTRALAYVADPPMALRNCLRFVQSSDDPPALLRHLRDDLEYRHLIGTLFSFSQYFAEIAIRDRGSLDRILRDEELRGELDRDAYAARLEAREGTAPQPARLAAFKRVELLRIGLRDLLELAPTEVLCRELTALAEALLEPVLERAMHEAVARHGMPRAVDGVPARFAVVAMGKFGSRELNFSSDIDLVYVYDEEGLTEGAFDATGQPVRVVSNHEFFNTVAARLGQIVDAEEADAHLYRVDTRLRPDGIDGPLTRSIVSWESYFARDGRAFEKVAYLRARAVAGDRALGLAFERLAESFVFTGNLAEQLVPEIASLKRRIDARQLDADGRARNIKQGIGGIREIEFIVSTLQLLHAVARTELRLRGTVDALDALGRAGILPRDEAKALRAAYFFFRRVEHTLQMLHNEQTHLMPDSPAERESLALRCGFRDVADFETRLAEHRSTVRELFAFYVDAEAADEDLTLAEALNSDAPPSGPVLEMLKRAGIGEPESWRALRSLVRGTSHHKPTAQEARALERLLPVLLADLPTTVSPPDALRHLDLLLRAYRGGAPFIELLLRREGLRALLLRSLGFGEWPARQLVAHPEWLDMALQGQGLTIGWQPAEAFSSDVHHPLSRDMPDSFDSLRRLRQREVTFLTLREVAGWIDPATAARLTSELAAAVLNAVAVRLAGEHIAARDWPEHWAIIALGGLGTGRVHFTSDLDIELICDASPPPECFTRFGQSLLECMTTLTGEGTLWRIDTRLRPDGSSGTLVTDASRFAQYFQQEAGTWEWLAMGKARPVAGDVAWAAGVLDACRAGWIARRPGREVIAADLRSMRRRIDGALRLPRYAATDLKRSPGGMWDLDFLLGLEVLSTARTPADLSPETSSWPAATFGREEAEFLRRHDLVLLAAQRALRLQGESATDLLPESEPKRRALRRGLEPILKDEIDAFDELPSAMNRMRALLRSRLGE